MDENINTPSVLNKITTEITNEITTEITNEITTEITNTNTENKTKLLEIQNIMQQKQKDYNIALTFINSNKKDLANIYLQHTSLLNVKTNNDNNDDVDNDDVDVDVDNDDVDDRVKRVKRVKGVLCIYLGNIDKNKIDVAFIANKVIPLDIITKIKERCLLNDENIIYFMLITNLEEKLIEIDIRSLLS